MLNTVRGKYFGFISLQVFFRCFSFEQTEYIVLGTFSLDFFFFLKDRV